MEGTVFVVASPDHSCEQHAAFSGSEKEPSLKVQELLLPMDGLRKRSAR